MVILTHKTRLISYSGPQRKLSWIIFNAWDGVDVLIDEWENIP